MASTPAAGWADLPLDLTGDVIARLPFPGDRARFAAVCRAWRSAVRQHASHLPWMVFPSGKFSTAGHGAACFSFRHLGGGQDDTATCLGAAHDCWLAIDCTDDVVRRTNFRDSGFKATGEPIIYPRRNVKHKHTYMLYNPFSGVTVPLPELENAIGHVAETFDVRKVLMRSPAPDDGVIAVTTNNSSYNIILCRQGKGTFVLPNYKIIDVAFLGDTLYGVTPGEELLAFHLGEDEDGRPHVSRIELVVKNPLSRYYHGEFPWFWPEQVVDTTSEEGVGLDADHNNGGGNNEEEEPDQEEDDNIIAGEGYQEEEDRNENDDESDDDELANQASLEDYIVFNGDDGVPNNTEPAEEEVPCYEPKDEIHIARYLVRSRSGEELLLVRHRYLLCPYSGSYTDNVKVLKADLSNGKWDASDGLAKGEALFLSRSYSKCTRARGDIQEGFVYYTTHLEDDAYDMTCCAARDVISGWAWQCRLETASLLTWLFPPEVVA